LNPKPQQVIQSIKKPDCSLESNKNFSETLSSNSWRPGPGEVARVTKMSSTYDVTDKKRASPKQKKFFQVKTTSLATCFDALTRSVTRTGVEIFLRKPTCESAVVMHTA